MFKKPKRNKEDSPGYLRPYADAARMHGSGFGTMLWHSTDGQKKRFEVIARMIDPTTRVFADLGCGRADLLAYLADINRLPRGYVGVDGIPEMSNAGQAMIREHPFNNAQCIHADFVADTTLFSRLVSDYGVAGFVFSGSLNTLDQPAARVLLSRAFQVLPSEGVLVFNFLSSRIPGGDTGETSPANRFDPVAFLDWAIERTPLVRLQHDYLGGHDATIRMQRP